MDKHRSNKRVRHLIPQHITSIWCKLAVRKPMQGHCCERCPSGSCLYSTVLLWHGAALFECAAAGVDKHLNKF
jgi:hypothetical protein